MKHTKKTTAFTALLLALLISLLTTSCESDNADTADTSSDNTTAETTTALETDYLETLPTTGYGGYEFRFLAQSYDQRPNLPLFEDENGEILNDTIIARNRSVEEKLDIKIINMPYRSNADVTNLVKTTVIAGEDAYDLVINSISGGINQSQNGGMLYDLADFEYLNLNADWWCSSVYEDHQLNGHIYFTTGPLSPFFYYMPATVAYNKTLTDNYGIESLEQTVLDGNWTFDLMKKYSAGRYSDLNGNGTADGEDRYGVSCAYSDGYMLGGFGERMITRDKNGGFVFEMDTEHYTTKLKALASFLSDKTVAFCNDNTDVFLSMFQNDQGMFMPTSMNNIITGYTNTPSCREMESDYGILPLPKYDEAQDDYKTVGQPAGPMGIAVPATCADTQRNSHIMEVMAYISGTMIREAAYDAIVKEKASRLDGTDEMLDMIYESVYFDLNDIFNFGNSRTVRTNSITNGGDSYVSEIAAVKEAALKGVDDYIAMLSDIG